MAGGYQASKNRSSGELLKVTVPDSANPGEAIHIGVPDGRGIGVQLSPTCKPGQRITIQTDGIKQMGAASSAASSSDTPSGFPTECFYIGEKPNEPGGVRSEEQHYWEHRAKGRWHPFPEYLNSVVETAYVQGDESIPFDINDEVYQVDFASLQQFCLSDPSRTRSVRRMPMRARFTDEVSSTRTRWEHKARDLWQPFWDDHNDVVEQAFKDGSPTATLFIDGEEYSIDFMEMKQRCVANPKRSRAVRRLDDAEDGKDASDACPAYWAVQSQHLLEIPCPSRVTERVQKLLNATYSNKATKDRQRRTGQTHVPKKYLVQSVVRVQNDRLWAKYSERRAAVRSVCARKSSVRRWQWHPVWTQGLAPEAERDALDTGTHEQYLFHGTSSSAAKAIAQQGMNLSMAKDGLLGCLACFAESITKADEYSTDAGIQTVLLFRVVLGQVRYTEDTNPDKAALKKDIASAHGRAKYHSVLADRKLTSGYREFAVADAAQVYPEYIIKYTRS